MRHLQCLFSFKDSEQAKRKKQELQNVKHSALRSGLKHLIEPWHTTSHIPPSDRGTISQHDSLDPAKRHLWSYTHATNSTAFVDVMKLG